MVVLLLKAFRKLRNKFQFSNVNAITLFTITQQLYTLANIFGQAAFAVACFWVLSDIHECLGDLRMATSPLDKQPAGYKSPHDWLLRI